MHMTSGAPEQLIVLPRPTYLPLWTALATAAAVLAMLFQFYTLSLVAALVTAGLFVLAGQSAGLPRDYGPLPIGHGISVPPHTEVTGSPPWLALNFALVADGTLFTSLLFGTLYLWISAPNWPRGGTPEPDLLLALRRIVALIVAAAAARGSLERLPPAARRRLDRLSRAGAVCGHRRCVVLIGGIVPAPREHALGATAAALLGYVACSRHRPSLSRQQPPAPRLRLHLAPTRDWICA